MDNFKIMYRILKYLEESLDEPNIDMTKISHEALGISFLRWEALLRLMQEEGYIKGLVYQQTMSDSQPHVVEPVRPSITIKGLEYLAENGIMKKMAEAAKRVKEIIPGI
jgi:hypothetical protein